MCLNNVYNSTNGFFYMRLILVIAVYLGVAYWGSFWPFEDKYAPLPYSQYEKVDVNAYFYFPDDTEIFLGQFKGASACQSAASNYAYRKNMSNANWSYICCTIEKGSSCYRKIK